MKPPLTPDEIKRVVSTFYGLTVADLESASRREHLILPRFISYWLVRHLLGVRLVSLGEHFPKNGKPRDHGTILYGCKSIDDQLAVNERLKRHVSALWEMLSDNFEVPPSAQLDRESLFTSPAFLNTDRGT